MGHSIGNNHTHLQEIGLSSEHQTRTYYDDPRVAGWLFGGGWDFVAMPSGTWEKAFFKKYWPWFKSLVRYGSGFAGTYSAASPDAANYRQHIDSIKQVFQELNDTPDWIGTNWYANTSYPVDSSGNVQFRSDLSSLVTYVRTAFPTSAVALMEGGTNQHNSSVGPFYIDALDEGVEGTCIRGYLVWTVIINRDPFDDIPRYLLVPPVVQPRSAGIGMAGQTLHVLERNALLEQVGDGGHAERVGQHVVVVTQSTLLLKHVGIELFNGDGNPQAA